MNVLTVFVLSEVWRRVNFKPAGRRLALALNSEIEDVRGIAGIGLAEAGLRSVPIIEESTKKTGPTKMSAMVIQDTIDLARERNEVT